MSVIHIRMSSLTTDDMRTLLRAWHQTRDYGAPAAIADAPTVKLDGAFFGVTLPGVYPDRAHVILSTFDAQRVGANGSERVAR